jgi:hypothetical protein
VTGFAKFDPLAFLEREKRIVANKDFVQIPNGVFHPTLASLATLAAAPLQKENEDDCQSWTTDDYHHDEKSQKFAADAAKIAKVAKVTARSTSIDYSSWREVEEERAAIAEFDGGAPRVWAEALARLDPARAPRDIMPKRWLCFIDDCGRFLDEGWAARAEELGWRPLELFGCDRANPLARIDRAGLLWFLNGGRLVALTAVTATIQTFSGARQTYRRCLIDVDAVALAWELVL